MSEKPLEVGEVGVIVYSCVSPARVGNIAEVRCPLGMYRSNGKRQLGYLVYLPGYFHTNPAKFPNAWFVYKDQIRRITDPDAAKSLTTAKEVSA